MKNELRKMGVDELKLKNIVTRGLESVFLYLKRTELFLWNGLTHSNTVGGTLLLVLPAIKSKKKK